MTSTSIYSLHTLKEKVYYVERTLKLSESDLSVSGKQFLKETTQAFRSRGKAQ